MESFFLWAKIAVALTRARYLIAGAQYTVVGEGLFALSQPKGLSRQRKNLAYTESRQDIIRLARLTRKRRHRISFGSAADCLS